MACTPYASIVGVTLQATSTTRPTGNDRYTGQRIFELDTGRTMMFDGTNWVIMDEPVQSTTPALTGMVIGTGGSASNALTYHRSDGFLDFEWAAGFGTSGTTFPTSPTFALPVAMFTSEVTFAAVYLDAGNFRYQGLAVTNSAGTLALDTLAAAPSGITTTTPFTWGAGDGIYVRGRYRMITRYS